MPVDPHQQRLIAHLIDHEIEIITGWRNVGSVNCDFETLLLQKLGKYKFQRDKRMDDSSVDQQHGLCLGRVERKDALDVLHYGFY